MLVNESSGLCSLVQSKCKDMIILGDIFSDDDKIDNQDWDEHSVSTNTNNHLS